MRVDEAISRRVASGPAESCSSGMGCDLTLADDFHTLFGTTLATGWLYSLTLRASPRLKLYTISETIETEFQNGKCRRHRTEL